ncbi:hypothetical protein TWF106_010806 [Orbilia oligospora]|uniref:Uncharacterized protein n=1 Tax=Orbilia oligospora TaxID=2813651 RepID=A0A7C8QEQ6_ORBOL|nr:hypothetical protein TWF106_010806 [Orbilia oligospora]
MPPSAPKPTIISPKPKSSTKAPLLLLQNNLQKILPRDPIEEILRQSSDSHIRSLLRSLCSSSQEIKEKAQQLHKQILELPVVPPPGINLSDGNYIVIPNKYNPRKRKPWNVNNSTTTTTNSNNNTGGGSTNADTLGGGSVVVGEETTGRRYRGQETYNRMMSSFYQTERNARRRFRFGMFEMGGSGSKSKGGDNDTKKSSSRRKSQDQLSPNTTTTTTTPKNNTSRPVSPRTKVLEMNPIRIQPNGRDYTGIQQQQQQQQPPAYSPRLSITSLDHIDYDNKERVPTFENEYNNISIGGFAEVQPIRLPSINETISRRMSYSLELPPILGLHGLEVGYNHVNVMDAVTAELSYASMKELEPGEIRSASAGGLEF